MCVDSRVRGGEGRREGEGVPVAVWDGDGGCHFSGTAAGECVCV